jgi:hypothetical protein
MKTLLFMLICLIALTAIFSGLMMVSSPDGKTMSLPLALLNGTPFKNFFIPGLLLATIVGGINLLAAFYNIRRHPNRYNWAAAGGVTICGWIILQMIIIQTIHWLHFIYLGIGLLIILIAYQLKGKWAV